MQPKACRSTSRGGTAHVLRRGCILPSLGPFMASLAEDVENVSQAALFLCRRNLQQEQLLCSCILVASSLQESSRFAALYLDRVELACIDDDCTCAVRSWVQYNVLLTAGSSCD